MLTTFAGAIGPVVVIPDPQWLGVALIGLYHTGAAALTLVLAIQLVGALYWGVEARRDVWRARIGPHRQPEPRGTFVPNSWMRSAG